MKHLLIRNQQAVVVNQKKLVNGKLKIFCATLALLYVGDTMAMNANRALKNTCIIKRDLYKQTPSQTQKKLQNQTSRSRRSSVSSVNLNVANSSRERRAITKEEEDQLEKVIFKKGSTVQEVEAFLKNKNINLTLSKDKGAQLIYDAAYIHNKSLIKLFIEYGADINSNSLAGNTPLILALIYHKSRDMMRCLIECGADVNAPGDADTPLGCILRGLRNSFNKEDVIYLINYKADVNQSCHVDAGIRRFPLEYVICEDKPDLQLIKLLIDHGANINQATSSGNTPLMRAAEKGYIDIVKLLLNQRDSVDINARNNEEQTALDLAQIAYSQHKKKLEQIAPFSYRRDKVIKEEDATQKCAEIISLLSEKGAKTGAELGQRKSSKSI